jgi:hypothetical protein
MSWRSEKTRTGSDLVWDEVELGIAPSPHKGTANIQNANISTESGEVLASYGRAAQHQTAITNGTLTPNGATDFTGPATLKAGTWISVSASTVTSISTTTTPTTVSADYLVVGGGGAGGAAFSGTEAGGGGGGAGAVLTGSSSLSVGTYTVTVGAGGVGGITGAGTSGSNSVFNSITATGGGKGGDGSSTGQNGSNGGSGGGGGGDETGPTTGTAGTGTTGGNNGGAGRGTANAAGGGGGGAGGTGTAAGNGVGGNGGTGTSSSITGTATLYGGGGGGGGASAGSGGTGGGGNGRGSSSGVGTDATANTGGGGGGAYDAGAVANRAGGDGGSGIVVISYPLGSMVATGGTISIVNGNVVHTFTESGALTVHSVAKTNLYYVSYASGTTFRLSSKFDPTGANAITHGTTGSITFSTVATPNQGVAKAVEKYTNSTSTEYRYYILDANSYVWMWDSAIYETYGTMWMLPDPTNYSSLRLTGLGALNGMLLGVGKAFIVGKPTVDLGRSFVAISDGFLNEPFPTHNNFALVGKQGKMYYCDGNYIGEVFPTTSLITSIANIQSQCSYTASSTTGTASAVISGSLPYSPDGTRIPVVFYTDVYGTQPTNVNSFTVYYIQYSPSAGTFEVYSAITGGSAINIATGAAGNQFFTTFWPFGAAGNSGSTPTVQISTQRVNLPANETAQCMVEVGNTVIIGGKTTTLYPWNQIDATPSDFIELPEADVKTMINVNNMAYVFAGNKGNVYITNNAVASLALKVPDYCAGVPGTPLTYIEPTFTWGDADYVRGRVYFSILDQTATKAGNCGGIWSFVPTQNIDPSQEVGMALRLENQQSYGDYDGYATIILANQEQNATSPQYWAAWQDSYSTGTSNFGIDGTATTPVTTYVVETDLLPSGTMLEKGTFQQLEYKLSTALASGDSVQIFYRTNSTDSWTSCGTVIEESNNKIAGYFNQKFQKTQYLQFRIVVTTGGTTASSFGRLKQLMLR